MSCEQKTYEKERGGGGKGGGLKNKWVPGPAMFEWTSVAKKEKSVAQETVSIRNIAKKPQTERSERLKKGSTIPTETAGAYREKTTKGVKRERRSNWDCLRGGERSFLPGGSRED